MANALLNSDILTDEAVAIFHEETQLVNKVDRQFDSSFGKEGAKNGDSLRIRKPFQPVVRTGDTMVIGDYVEEETSLVVATLKGVDLEFSSTDLTMSIDAFSEKVIKPSVSRLAAEVETVTAENLYSQVGNYVYNAGGLVWKDAVKANSILAQNAAPDIARCTMVDPMSQVEILDNTKGLFQSAEQIKGQYEKGKLGVTGGSTWYSTTYNPSIVIGADVLGTVNAAPVEGMSTIVLAGLGANQVIAKGTIITVDGSKMIQPETKKAYGNDKGLAVIAEATADGAGAVTVSVLPLYALTGRQNISILPTNGAAVTIVGAVDSTLRQSVEFQKGFGTFVSVNQIVPSGVDMASSREFEGISLRLVRNYDINANKFPCRLDVLFGSAVIRPELAVRMLEVDA